MNPCLKEQQNLEIISLYSVCDLCLACGELCKTCLEDHPSFICLTEMHLCAYATDNFCPQAMLSQQDTIELNTYGGGVLILAMDLLF